jgi:hypothetical protein
MTEQTNLFDAPKDPPEDFHAESLRKFPTPTETEKFDRKYETYEDYRDTQRERGLPW